MNRRVRLSSAIRANVFGQLGRTYVHRGVGFAKAELYTELAESAP